MKMYLLNTSYNNSIFILGRIYKWLFRAKIGAWFRMCGNTMGISTDVNSLSVKTNRERAMSIASTREMRNLIPGTCVPKHAKIFYILPKRDTQLTLEEDLKVFLYMAFIQKVLTQCDPCLSGITIPFQSHLIFKLNCSHALVDLFCTIQVFPETVMQLHTM